MPAINLTAKVPKELGGKRFDLVAAELFSQHSRSRLQTWIRSGELTVDGEMRKARQRLYIGEVLTIAAEIESLEDLPEEMPLQIVYEDESILVVDKPAGLVAHPAAGNRDHTLLNALLHHDEALKKVPRAGIVHRLDKDTSGLMVVAKTVETHTLLANLIQAREVTREYQAMVYGVVRKKGVVTKPIGRDSYHRTRMAVRADGKEAITHFEPLRRYQYHSHLAVRLGTGRTHQIRVHMSSIGFPLIGDVRYGGTYREPKNAGLELKDALRDIGRQALHACALELVHPVSQERCRWESSLPDDLKRLLAALEAESKVDSVVD